MRIRAHSCLQVLQRLFPFGRGLCHAYWAPNAWALYSFADKMLAAVAAKAGLLQASTAANMAGGIVGVAKFLVLPQITPGITAALVLVAMAPCLVCLWRNPDLHKFAAAVGYANLCGFMFGYHVHEKAVLTFLLPLALEAVRNVDAAADYILLSTASHVSLFPLLFKLAEIPIKWLLTVLYWLIAVAGLHEVHSEGKSAEETSRVQTRSGARQGKDAKQSSQTTVLPIGYQLYMAGLVGLELYCTIGHQALGLHAKLPFVPLMLTSVYCSLGVSWVWLRMMLGYLQQCSSPAHSMTKKQR